MTINNNNSSNSPLITVIVPNYNHSKFLKERLDSVFSQSYKNIEVILLDDSSSDKSEILLKEYALNKSVTHFIVNNKNSGSTFKQWDKGINLANGEFIWLAESDDIAELTFLEDLINFQQIHKEKMDVIYSQSFDINEKSEILSNRLSYTSNFTPNIWRNSFSLEGNDFILDYMKVKNVLPNASAAIFRTDSAKKIDLFAIAKNMRICGDWLFWIEMIKNGNIGFVAKELNYFRIHGDVTRVHNTKDKVFNRCREEKIIRILLNEILGINQKKEILSLYERWFKANSFKDIFCKDFYQIKLKQTTLLLYLFWFFLSHLKILKIVRSISSRLSI
ncbi:glycosyltransferase [Paraglaciecola sp. L3A3]|uniref:glycosyltransferase family 2 protein n=1 Tax=Paraglaciecola sp. L3A3 TaxID=2686358 RepID=UPI00131C801C|nr:glycosyltransferase [Paraglaciecola sp. L3A3]